MPLRGRPFHWLPLVVCFRRLRVFRNRLLLPVYVPTLLLTFGQGLLIPVVPLYARSFEVSFSLVSLAVAASGVGTLMGDVPSGLLLSRVSRRLAMLIGTLTVALSTLAIGLATHFPEVVALRLVAGVGMALWSVSRLAYLTDATPIAERGRAISVFGGVSRIGALLGPISGGVIATQFGLHSAFFAAGGIAAGAALFAGLLIAEMSETRPAVPVRSHWREMADLLRRNYRDLIAAGIAQTCAQMIRAGRQIIIPLYGADVLGLDVSAIGMIISVSAILDVSLFYPAGIIMDRFGRKFASVPSFLVLGGGMALVPLAHDYVGLLVAGAVMGLGNGIGSGTMMTLGADLAPRDSAGPFLGLWRLIGDSGQTGGPLVVGGVADLFGLATAALVLAGVGLAAAVTLRIFVRETLEARPALSPEIHPR
ncbi:MAG: MFS transporter [Chloroflexi bacterium]|nr:MFS transporter [Chloroflexota bacterium]